MPDRGHLYELTPAGHELPRGLPLVAGLTGFADAGGVVTQLGQYLHDALETTTVAVFDNDDLLDYRARRPTILFDRDHLAEYNPATLTISLARDEVGSQFFLLTGYEPDFRWERFVESVLEFIEEYQLDPRREFAEMFCCWNTGRPHGRTYDPHYVENGLRRMQIYHQLGQIQPAAR